MDNGYERGVDLKDLLFYILYKWRAILLAALAFCALAGGYRRASDMAEAREEGSGGKTRGEREYEIKLTEYELAKAAYERDMADFQARLAQQGEYMGESVLMQADPYNVPSASADFFVKLDGAEWAGLPDNTALDPTDSLISAYTSNFLSTLDWGPVEALTGTDARYLKELVSVGADYNSNTFTVRVRHKDGGTAQQMLDAIVGQVMGRYQAMDAGVSRHALAAINRALAYTIDSSLADAQKGNADALAGYEQAINGCRAGLEGLKEPRRPSGMKKYLALGFAAGGLLAAAAYGMAYMLDGRMHPGSEPGDRYGWNLLGYVPRPAARKPLAAIDRLIGRLGGDAGQPAGDGAYQVIAANIANLAGGSRDIMVTGTAGIEKLQGLVDAVAPELGGITLTAAEDMNLSADTLKKLAQCDAVILVEGRHVSLMEGIRREHGCIAALGKPVVGYVLL